MKKRLLIAFALLLAAFSSAQAQIVNTLPFNLQNNTTADATQAMADFLQIVNNVNTNAAKNGSNNDITALLALTTPLTPVQGGSSVYTAATSTGSANSQVVSSPIPTGFSLAINKRIVFTAGFTNTSATTFNISSTGATAVFKLTPTGSAALTGGEIVVGSIVEAIYDGTQYQLITNNLALLGPLMSLASASTADFGTISSHNISLTGTTTITSFGSTAVTSTPIYYFTLAGAITLTYNATSLIIPGATDFVGAAGDSGAALYLGSGNWRILSITRANGLGVLPSPTPLCGAIGFTMTNNAGTPSTSIDMAAEQAVMLNSAGVAISASSVAVTVNTTTTGANALDTGTRANSTWYNFYLISNGTATAGLASLSATSPTMPSGYTYKCRLGAMRTDGSANFYRTLQIGAVTQYKVVAGSNTLLPPLIQNGTLGTVSVTSPTLATITVKGSGSNVIPPTAGALFILARATGGGAGVLVAPNTSWGGANNGPAGANGVIYPVYASSSTITLNQGAWIDLEATTIAAALDNANDKISILSWRDVVNAN
jgi:hypothetical protein